MKYKFRNCEGSSKQSIQEAPQTMCALFLDQLALLRGRWTISSLKVDRTQVNMAEQGVTM